MALWHIGQWGVLSPAAGGLTGSGLWSGWGMTTISPQPVHFARLPARLSAAFSDKPHLHLNFIVTASLTFSRLEDKNGLSYCYLVAVVKPRPSDGPAVKQNGILLFDALDFAYVSACLDS